MLSNLSELGFYDFLLPWIFTFAIVYGLLMKAGIFGDVNKKVSGMLAIVIAFFVTANTGPAISEFFTAFFGPSAIFMTGLLVVILFAVLVGYDAKVLSDRKGNLSTLLVLIAVGAILFLTATSAEFSGVKILSSPMLSTFFVVGLVLVAVYYIVHEEGKKEEKPKKGPNE